MKCGRSFWMLFWSRSDEAKHPIRHGFWKTGEAWFWFDWFCFAYSHKVSIPMHYLVPHRNSTRFVAVFFFNWQKRPFILYTWSTNSVHYINCESTRRTNVTIQPIQEMSPLQGRNKGKNPSKERKSTRRWGDSNSFIS